VASNHFNLSSVTTVALLFVLITIPQARLVDRMVERDQRRMRAGGSSEPRRDMALIEIRDIHKRFGEHEVFKGLSLEVEEHQVVCLIGLGLREIDLAALHQRAGDHRAGRDPHPWRPHDRAGRRQCAAPRRRHRLSELQPLPHMTVLRTSPSPLRVLRQDRRTAEATAMALLTRIGLESKAREYPDRLSGGQQQRVAIVRARHGAHGDAAGRDHLGPRPRAGRRGAGTSCATSPRDGTPVLLATTPLAKGWASLRGGRQQGRCFLCDSRVHVGRSACGESSAIEGGSTGRS
jgi:hypothetical protein